MNKAFLGRGGAAGPRALLENVAGPAPSGERVNPETQDQREESGIGAPVGRRETMGEMESAAKVAKAKKEKEGSPDTQVPRVCPVSQEQVELRDPKASEAEGEIRDLQGRSDRRETPVTQDHPAPKATEATRSINAPSSRASKTNAPAATGPWNAPSSLRNWPLL